MTTPATGTSSSRRSSRLSKGTSHISNKSTTRTNKPRRSHVSKENTQRLPSAPTATQILYLRVNRKFLLLFPTATEDQPNPQPLPPLPGTSGNLNVIIADLADLHPFSGGTVDWLIKVARLIFEPLGTSSIYTFTTESLEWWLDREMEPTSWRPVQQGEQLRGTIYEFRPDNDSFITLTQMSARHARSMTTTTSAPLAVPFRTALLRRHERCIITRQPIPVALIASHLIPRRLGDAAVQSAFHPFTGSPTVVSRFDPLIRVPLVATLDAFVDSYQLGFWNYGPNQYVVHSFVDAPLNVYGVPPLAPNELLCHGYQITLTTHDPLLNLPPVGVFNWHYTQCILKKFSTADYQKFNNIYYFVLPFRTRDDDDDESDREFDDDRNIANPPYPSYLWELSEVRERERLEAVERRRTIEAWNSGFSVS